MKTTKQDDIINIFAVSPITEKLIIRICR